MSFAAGETSKTITVQVAGDSTLESDEGFTVSLSNASSGTAIGTATATGTIQNDDASLATVSVVAGRAIGREGDAVYQKDGYSPYLYTQRSKSIYNAWSFAAINQDGSVVTWGRADKGADSALYQLPQLSTDEPNRAFRLR